MLLMANLVSAFISLSDPFAILMDMIEPSITVNRVLSVLRLTDIASEV